MSGKDKDMSGVLFKNDRKTTDKHPDYKGSAIVNGQAMWLSAWINVNEDGSKRMSLSFQPKEQQQRQEATRQAPKRNAYAERDNGFDDRDPPF